VWCRGSVWFGHQEPAFAESCPTHEVINPGKLGEGMTGSQSYVCCGCTPRPEMDCGDH
jgi:hypothetical protein